MDQIRRKAHPSQSSPTTTANKHDLANVIKSQRKLALWISSDKRSQRAGQRKPEDGPNPLEELY
jgi:hypothetical protein